MCVIGIVSQCCTAACTVKSYLPGTSMPRNEPEGEAMVGDRRHHARVDRRTQQRARVMRYVARLVRAAQQQSGCGLGGVFARTVGNPMRRGRGRHCRPSAT